ncbi:MAG: aminotransferase class I/II-fold pyridoxal phosphate-dependent enzyme [Chloroflexi bacterium]|nr:MAG: aminotransferase class I/II-fold pyridoxal phosphate-dependent enzyme [Chloroflexota bacterium]
MRYIELRSDTFTKPTPAMRKAMADAEVGDDQYGEDPTVNRLEKRASEIVGKEAGVYVPSGMMGNLCGVLSQTQRGDEVVLGDLAHIVQNEMGACFVVGGVVPRLVPNRDGFPSLDDLASAVRPQGMFPRTSLVCLENSHNNCGGAVITAEQTKSIADFAHLRGMRVHLDGARIFNAAAALGVEAKALVRDVDTVQFCFSKGLAAPVGSILCGDGETVAKARRVRKMLGGAMRQAGVIAAAALVGLEEMRDRLVEDHRNAQRFAQGLAEIPGVRIDPRRAVTNIVSFEIDPAVMDAGAFQKACAEKGLRVSRYLGNSPRLRAVTHLDVTRDDIDAALEIARAVLIGAPAAVTAGR